MSLSRMPRRTIRIVGNRMKHKDYWRKRFELLEQSQNRTGKECFAEIEKQYRAAQRTLEGEITKWYQRFAKNNGITMQQARQMLNAGELEELKWDVQEYIRHGKENAVNGAWMIQLENASARYHISRLEALKLQVQQSLEVMFGNQLDSIDAAMRKSYKEGYYKTAYEIQKGTGVGWDFSSLDERKIGKVIKKPWAADGKNFSERIWDNRRKLVNEVHTEISRNIITGQDPQKAINAISRKMKTSKSNAGRLVMTELAFFSSEAQGDCFRELGVEQFEIVATLDGHTSEICREMDGKHFPMSQYEAGITAPPFHVWCRSCTCPYLDHKFDSKGKRAARAEDGRTYYVPGDMTYRDWQESFVKKPLDKEGGKAYNKLKIGFSDDILKIDGMTPSIRKQIDSAIEGMMEEYDIKLSSLTVEPAGKGDLFVTGWYDGKMGLVINSNADFEKVMKTIPRRYNAGYFAGKSLEDYIAHEMFHVMAYQDCKTKPQYRAKFTQIENLFGNLKGISKYADKSGSGNEALAEAFVRMRNGEKVPELAKVLVEAYIGRWKK